MRKSGLLKILVLILPIAFMIGCATYPYPLQEFKDADMAIKNAEKVGQPEVNPADVQAAKDQVTLAYEVYVACRTDEARKILAKAIELANKRNPKNQGPTAVIEGPMGAKVGEVVYFSGEKSSDPEMGTLTYDWTFGDGSSSQGAVANHSWSKAGKFPVALKVTDPDGLSDTAEVMVNVGPAAPAKKFITMGNTVLFDFDKSNIKPAGKTILDDIASTLMKDKDLKVKLDGYTDWIGTAEYNMGLSKRRAYAVHDYLVKKGVDKSRFTVKWHGENDPVANNKTKEGRARNRRTEITLTQ